MDKQLLVPEDEIIKKIKIKMKSVTWEKVERELPTEYLIEIKPFTLDEKFHINPIVEGSDKEGEEIIQKEIEEILNEFQDIVFKEDHDIGNCNLIEHAIRLT